MNMQTTENRFVRAAAVVVLLFNLLDAALTLLWTTAGVATEANPLLAPILERSPVEFMAIKVALVTFGVLLLWRLRWRQSARTAMVAGALAYSALVVYHLSNVDHLVAILT
jgi:hypothetical protein